MLIFCTTKPGAMDRMPAKFTWKDAAGVGESTTQVFILQKKHPTSHIYIYRYIHMYIYK